MYILVSFIGIIYFNFNIIEHLAIHLFVEFQRCSYPCSRSMFVNVRDIETLPISGNQQRLKNFAKSSTYEN